MTRKAPDSTNGGSGHRPVLLREVVDTLAPRDGRIYVDGTFGGGGYSRVILEAAECTVWGIDRDAQAIAEGAKLVQDYTPRLFLVAGRFGEMDELLAVRGVGNVDGVALDLGVSSMQLDRPERGFSFRRDGPLDMRMEGEGAPGPSAAALVNTMAEEALADVIYRYGEERMARRIARAIVEARKHKPITRTGQLAEIVRGVVRKSHDGIDPATRTFQALRILVNGELEEIDRGLGAAERILAPGGRLAVVSYHSLEDRKVKQFLRIHSGSAARPSRHLPDREEAKREPPFKLLVRRPIRPGKAEIAANPRARSARLRAAERSATPPLGQNTEGQDAGR